MSVRWQMTMLRQMKRSLLGVNSLDQHLVAKLGASWVALSQRLWRRSRKLTSQDQSVLRRTETQMGIASIAGSRRRPTNHFSRILRKAITSFLNRRAERRLMIS